MVKGETGLSSDYRISQPIRRTFFFLQKNVTYIQPASYALRVSIISKLINIRTSIIQHLYHETVKTTMKMISGSDDNFLGFYDE